MNKFNEQEFKEICRQFNCKPNLKDITINFDNSSFFNKMRKSVEKDRRGEVVFCVIRPNDKIITVTCEEYPKGVYRIPTGGINYGEEIVEAVYRETREELGITAKVEKFAGVLRLKFVHGNESVMFYSYMFILRETGGRLLVDASDNEISEVMEVDIEELEKVVDVLRNIPGRWNNWGKFRFATSNAILQYMKTGAF